MKCLEYYAESVRWQSYSCFCLKERVFLSCISQFQVHPAPSPLPPDYLQILCCPGAVHLPGHSHNIISSSRPGLKISMDFKGLVLKRVSKISFLGAETGSRFREPGGTPHQEFPGVPPPPRGVVCQRLFPLVHYFVLYKKYRFPTVKSALLPLFYIFTYF